MTRYAYATWADLISSNFDEYYNYGRPGSSNTLIMQRFIEANQKFNFNSDDTVMVMFTGIGRYSYYTDEDSWVTNGDLHPYLSNNKHPTLESFMKNMWSENWAVNASWVAMQAIKNILELKSIPHRILIGVNNDRYLNENAFVNDESVKKASEIMNSGINKEPFDNWTSNNKPHYIKSATQYYTESKIPDGHPSQRMHYLFVKKFLPEYDTEKTRQTFEYVESIFEGTTQLKQDQKYKELFHRKYNKATQYPLFGQVPVEI